MSIYHAYRLSESQPRIIQHRTREKGTNPAAETSHQVDTMSDTVTQTSSWHFSRDTQACALTVDVSAHLKMRFP